MELWTRDHAVTLLPTLTCMLVLAYFLRRLLIGRSDFLRMLPLRIIACMLVLLEIGKQGLSLCTGYDLYNLPFHFCSLFISAVPVMAFYTGKHRQTVRGVVCALCASMTLLLLIYPNLIYGAGSVQSYFESFMSFHTVTFHNLVMLCFILSIALEIHTPQAKGEGKCAVLFTLGFCVVSATMAQLLKTNFANYYSCNIPALEAVRLSMQQVLGYGLTQLIYVSILSVLTLLFVYGSYWAYRGLRRLAGTKQAV